MYTNYTIQSFVNFFLLSSNFSGGDELKKVFRDCTNDGNIRCVKVAIKNGM